MHVPLDKGNAGSGNEIATKPVRLPVQLGTLRNHDGSANENVTSKYKFVLLVLLCAYSNAFNFYNAAELSSHRTGGNGLQVSTQNEDLLSCAHALHKTLNFGCLVPRPLSVFHLGESVSGHVVRAKKRGLDKNQKLRQMSQFFSVAKFHVEGFAKKW